MHFDNVEEAIAYWYQHINYEQKSATPKDLKLDRMRDLLARLDDPQKHLRIIHVAGSKGKGSTSAFLASVLQHAGYTTGLFTSPHLSRVEERMQINGQAISAEELTDLINEVRVAVDHAPALDVTFFEIGVAVGFLHFLRKQVDLAVVEVGLGGRFDSTNVCHPLLAVITSISFDHVRQLGNTLSRIAREKAGIIKSGVTTISGVIDEQAREVIVSTCNEKHSPLLQRDVDFHYVYEPGTLQGTQWSPPRARFELGERVYDSLELGLLGEHQAANAALAVACMHELQKMGWHISETALATGLAKTAWPARLEMMSRTPVLILDCAHNDASASALIETLQTSFGLDQRKESKRILIFACSHDKDQTTILQSLLPHFNQVLLPHLTDQPRLVSPESTASRVRELSEVEPMICDTVESAWALARESADDADLICVTGSVFLAGAMRPLLMPVQQSPSCS